MCRATLRRVAGQECGDMTRHRHIGFERQPNLLKSDRRSSLRLFIRFAKRKESFEKELADFVAIQFNRNGAGHQSTAASRDRDRQLGGSFAMQQRLLGVATGMPERNGLPRVELDAFFRLQAFRGKMRQRQIHIIAADQQMIADGAPLQHQFALILGRLDQRQIRRASAHVADQHHIAGPQMLAPLIPLCMQPGVHRGLRFLEQHEDAGSPASNAASRVNSRALASNDAGTVSTTCCWGKGASGCKALKAAAMCCR